MDKQPTVSVEKQKKKQAARASPFPTIRLVCLWAISNAVIVAAAFAVTYYTPFAAYIDPRKLVSLSQQLTGDLFSAASSAATSSSEKKLFPPPVQMTAEMEAMGNALVPAHVWCSVPQGAAATVALMLAGHRRRARRALAYAALAAGVAGHVVCACLVRLVLTVAPGDLFLRIGGPVAVIFFAVGDLICFLALLLGSEKLSKLRVAARSAGISMGQLVFNYGTENLATNTC